MEDQAPPPAINQDDWAATPAAVCVLVTELLQRVARATSHNLRAEAAVLVAQAQVWVPSPSGRRSG